MVRADDGWKVAGVNMGVMEMEVLRLAAERDELRGLLREVSECETGRMPESGGETGIRGVVFFPPELWTRIRQAAKGGDGE